MITLMIKKFFGSILTFVVFYMWRSNIQHGDFTPISNVKGFSTEKLSQLHNIRQRRLLEPRESRYRMEDVCDQIPETLAGADLEAVGRHWSRYQKFTKNQDRLRGSVKPHELIKKIVSPETIIFICHAGFSSRVYCLWKAWIKIVWENTAIHQFPNVKDGALREPTWKTDWDTSPWTIAVYIA